MPIYMDRHDVSESVTAEIVAELHQKDLKVQHKFGCRGLTYWFDDERKTAFCLIEAPNEEKLKEMHDHAHGQVPHRIIEVEPSIVESFLGRIEDPVKAKNTALNIINDPAFRIIMLVEPEIHSYGNMNSTLQHFHSGDYEKQVAELVQDFEGRMVSSEGNRFLISFRSVSQAVQCALELESSVKQSLEDVSESHVKMKIALNAGVPVNEKGSFFESTVRQAESMYFINSGIIVTEEINDLYRSENSFLSEFHKQIFVLPAIDHTFLNHLMDFTDKEYQNASLTVKDFQLHLGLSKTQLYRKMKTLTGNSPNNFLLLFRLKRILHLLHRNTESISEIAYSGGFSSPSYFAKCFRKVYGLSPSVYKTLI